MREGGRRRRQRECEVVGPRPDPVRKRHVSPDATVLPGSPASRVSVQGEPVGVLSPDEDQLYGSLLVRRGESAVADGQINVQPVAGNDLPGERSAQQRDR